MKFFLHLRVCAVWACSALQHIKATFRCLGVFEMNQMSCAVNSPHQFKNWVMARNAPSGMFWIQEGKIVINQVEPSHFGGSNLLGKLKYPILNLPFAWDLLRGLHVPPKPDFFFVFHAHVSGELPGVAVVVRLGNKGRGAGHVDSRPHTTNALSTSHFLCSRPTPSFLCWASEGGMYSLKKRR